MAAVEIRNLCPKEGCGPDAASYLKRSSSSGSRLSTLVTRTLRRSPGGSPLPCPSSGACGEVIWITCLPDPYTALVPTRENPHRTHSFRQIAVVIGRPFQALRLQYAGYDWPVHLSVLGSAAIFL